jgi:hypothetical protein
MPCLYSLIKGINSVKFGVAGSDSPHTARNIFGPRMSMELIPAFEL